jgi:hypothetical protein
LLDSAPVSTLPDGTAKITTKPGDHVLTVKKNGYVTQIMNLTLSGGRSKSVQVDLVEVPKPIVLPLGNIKDLPVDNITTGDEDDSLMFLGSGKSALYKIQFKSDRSVDYVRQISNPGFSGITNIVWGPKKDAALFQKGSAAYFFDFQKYNFVSQQEVKFGDDIGNVAWAPDDSKIAYSYAPSPGEQSIIFADKANTNIKRALNLKDYGITNPYLRWSPSSEWLLIIPRNTDASGNKIYLLNAYTMAVKNITDTGNNQEALYSPDGNKIIYTTTSDDPSNPVKSEVSVMNSDGSNARDLGIKAIISKIVWIDNSNIAVATYDPETQQESLFKFNVDSKQKIGFSIPLSGVYITELSISKDNKTLYFVSNNHLYQTGL